MTHREQLRELFRQQALQFGEFTLASGRKSTYKLFSNKALFNAEGMAIVGELLADAIADLEVDAIGGPETGAISMTAAALVACHHRGRALRGFFVRKEAKPNGGGLLAGELAVGDRVALVEDVLTTGGSVLKAIAAIEAYGATVVRVVGICDRLEGAATALAAYDLRTFFTIRDFGIEPPTIQ